MWGKITATRVPDEAQAAILAWYGRHGASSPSARRPTRMRVLVSEVMAQQTQVSRVEAGWSTFMAAFPTIEALAAAPVAEVLRAWRGLGYNRRALNLWRAARAVVDEHGGELPLDVAALERLPGVGPLHGEGRRRDRVRHAGRCRRHERAAGACPGRRGLPARAPGGTLQPSRTRPCRGFAPPTGPTR